MFNCKKNLLIATSYFVFAGGVFLYFYYQVNLKQTNSIILAEKQSFLRHVQIASPSIITGGRNIAFESGLAAFNAPASYLNLLDCCESDEAISSRIAIGQTKCKIIKASR